MELTSYVKQMCTGGRRQVLLTQLYESSLHWEGSVFSMAGATRELAARVNVVERIEFTGLW